MDRPAHAGIAKEGGAAREDLFVGRLHVRVRAHHGGYPAVEEPAHGDFFTGRFPVDIDEDAGGFRPHLGNGGIDRAKGVLQDGLHKSTRLDIDHAHFSLGRLQHDGAAARSSFRIVERPQEPRLEIEKREDVLLIPDMVAGGDHGNARPEKIDGNLAGDPAAGSGVLSVRHNEIECILFLQFRQSLDDSMAAGLAHDVAQEKDP